MDTKTFLNLILPERGVKFLARIHPRPGHPKGDATIHYVVGDADDAADKALELNAKFSSDNIYFAMASFKEVEHKTAASSDGREFTYVAGRKKTNVARVKCLWQDIDVKPGKDGHYQSVEEAKTGLATYLKATGLPAPLIVSSGYGLHCYWLFSECVSGEEWEEIAKFQRATWKHLGVLFDAAADADSARILRPPGTHNRKAGREVKEVRVVRAAHHPLPAGEYKRRLRGYCDANDLTSSIRQEETLPEWLRGNDGNLTAVVPTYPDTFAAVAVEHCGQLRELRDTGGTSEPVWYAALGVLKHMKDGEQYAHEWSARHEGYDRDDTQAKLDQWSTGPTTCARFKELNPSACEGCKQSCRSPVQLGLAGPIEDAAPTPPPLAAEQVAVAAVPQQPKADTSGKLLGWPQGFGYDERTGNITTRVEADGVWHQILVARPLFYPTKTLKQEDGTYALHCEIHMREGDVVSFELPLKHCADPKALKAALSARNIYVMHPNQAQRYVAEYADNIRRMQKEVETYQQQGWHHDFKAFLLGDKLVTADDEIPVSLGHWLKRHDVEIFEPNGSKEAWVQGINELYNVPHAEPHQLAIGNAFGSILNPLLRYNEWKGIPLALTSTRSGYGKSTVFKLAHSIYARQDSNTLTLVEDSTPKALLNRASAMNNLPFLMDEVTKYLNDPEDLMNTLYALSNGGPRDGLRSDGTSRDLPPSWRGSFAMTGNRGVIHQLTESKVTPEATQMRVFEIDLESYPRIVTMDKHTRAYKEKNDDHQLLAQHLLDNSHGVIGREWIRFVIKHREEVEAKLQDTALKLRKLMRGDATKERYYYHWATCTLVGLYFARKLGYVQFDVTHLTKWVVKHVARLRESVEEYRNTPEDHFADMMAALHGKIIVTNHFEKLDGRAGKSELPLIPINRTPVSGRYVRGDEKERAKLYITVKAVSQWCKEAGVSFTAFRREALKAGLIRLGTDGCNRSTGAVQAYIGKGVPGYTQLRNPWCFEFDADVGKMVLENGEPQTAEVVALARAE